ncbi:MAG: bifunctional demethylmenaquinone methyltransferase/2-methoxy-6-polyprenyl-1,4-benzoquinol methylase UbiE [Proteobacteria bacterium]|nr:bifunctional demethylmenaquinone methyltransferase/2-methoxy-6-polyprenyl-1,4-benzoquinol methylase UbiE [Pseudomonadota bacterium]
MKNDHKTYFGFQEVTSGEKTQKVKAVFSSVATQYDIMNDLMSLGIHRWWKHYAIDRLALKAGQVVLDLAGGSGDLTSKVSPIVGDRGQVYLADINEQMLKVGRARLLDQGLFHNISVVQADAETLPFADNFFDRIIIAFGLRNVTHQPKAMQSMCRVLKPGGRLIVLEFSQPIVAGLKPLYDWYSFKVLPWLGEVVAEDAASYQYLAESIRMHPNQETLKQMLIAAGFDRCEYRNLTGGIVAIHEAVKY